MPSFDFIHEGAWRPRTSGEFGLAPATGLSPPADSQAALIQAEGGGVRYRDDGTAATGTDGMLIADGNSVFYTGDLDALTFAADGGGAGLLNVLYYGWSD